VDCVYVGLKPSNSTSLRVSYETDKSQGGGRNVTTGVFDFNTLNFADFTFYTDIYDENVVYFNLFDFATLDFSNFTFQFSSYPQEFKKKIKAKRISHFQLTVANDRLNEGLTILSLVIKYQIQNYIK
jgi:hypothetical protein